MEDDLEGARRLYLEAVAAAREPEERARLLIHAAWLSHLLQDRSAAAEQMDRALQEAPRYPFRPELYSDDFVAIYRQALERQRVRESREAAMAINRAAEAIREGRLDEARGLLQQVLAERPDDPLARFNLALLAEREGQTEEALAHLERVLTRAAGPEPVPVEPELLARIHAAAGRIHLQRDLPLDAASSLERAAALQPGDPQIQADLGLVRLRLGEPERAIEAFERARALAPDDTTVMNNLAIALLESARPQDAVEILRDATRASPDDAELWLNLGLAQRAAERADEEIVDSLSRAVRLAEDADGVRRTALDTLIPRLAALERWPELVDAARERLPLGETAEAWLYRGLAESRLGGWADAAGSFERSLDLDPRRAETANNLGTALFELGRLREAAEAFEQALRIDPAFELARQNLDATRRLLASGSGTPRTPTRLPAPSRETAAAPAGPGVGLQLEDARDPDSGMPAARVVAVDPGSAAARAGLQPGDLVVRLDGRAIESAAALLRALRSPDRPGLVFLDVVRDGRALRLEFR